MTPLRLFAAVVLAAAPTLFIRPAVAAENPCGASETLYVLAKDGATVSVAMVDTDTDKEIRRSEKFPYGSFDPVLALPARSDRLYVFQDGIMGLPESFVAVSVADAAVTRLNKRAGASLLAVTADGSRAYMSNSTDLRVFTFADQTTKVVRIGKAINVGLAVSPDGARVYLSNLRGGVVAVDTANGEVVAEFSLGGSGEIVVSPDGKFVYVARRAQSKIAKLDAATLKVTAELSAGGRPSDFVLSPDGARLYYDVGSIAVVDTAKMADPRRFDGVRGQLAISPNGGCAYVVSREKTWKITTADHAVRQISLVGDANGVAFRSPPMEARR